MSNVCSNCGESKAMYCPRCMHKLQKRVEKLEALVKEKVEETTLIYRSLKYWSIKARELENKETP